jgi:hypothetical protein
VKLPPSGRQVLAGAVALCGLGAAAVASAGFVRAALALLALLVAGAVVVLLEVRGQQARLRTQVAADGKRLAAALKATEAAAVAGTLERHRALEGAKAQVVALERRLAEETRKLEKAARDTAWAPAGTGPFPFGMGVDAEYARRCLRGGGAFEAFAVSSGSLEARNAFARAASSGRFGWCELVRVVRMAHAGYRSAVTELDTFAPVPLCSLARVLMRQRREPADAHDARLLYDGVVARGLDWAMTRADRYLHLEAVAADDPAAVDRIAAAGGLDATDPAHVATVRADVAGADDDTWLKIVNEPYRAAGLEGIALRDGVVSGVGPRFARLRAETAPDGDGGALVSVIVPGYGGGPRAEAVLDSLLAQSWRDLEILVVTDDEAGARLAGRDPRVTHVPAPRGLDGTAARNLGLERARGDYVTCHTADEWSHPRKLAAQARHLGQHPDAVAVVARHVHVTDDLVFTRTSSELGRVQPDPGSLMFRREDVAGRLGGWYGPERAAAEEFRERLEAAFGTAVDVVGELPMTFTRAPEASGPHALHHARAYRRWHRSAPASWLPAHAPALAGAPGALDLVFGTDFRFPGGTSALTLTEARAALGAGYSVGLLQLDSPVNGPTAPLTEAYWATLDAGVHPVTLADPCRVGAVVVRHPSVLQYADELDSALDVGALALIVNHPAVLADGSGASFDVDTAAARAERLFGRRPRVHPESGVTRQVLATVVDPRTVENGNWPGFVGDTWLGTPRTVADRTPVVGRHSRDQVLKWPDDLADVRAAYCGGDVFGTRVLGGVASLTAAHGEEVTAEWTVHAFNDVTPAEFLAGVDFWVYFHHRDLTESFGMATAEAMAAGCVVVLPRYMEQTFGDGAVYATPAETRGIVQALWSDPGAYRAQSERAVAFARANLTETSFLGRLRALLATDES